MKRARLMLVIAVLGGGIPATLCDCGDGDLDVTLNAPGVVAIGATFNVSGRDDCPASGSNDCTQQTVKLDQVRVDDPTVLKLGPVSPGVQVASASLQALREGSTQVHARLDNGQQLKMASATVRVAKTDRIVLDGLGTCKAPYLIGADAPFVVQCRRYSGAELLAGVGGAFPLTSDVATPDPSSGDHFKAHASRGRGVVQSLLDTASIPIEVYEASQVTSMTLELSPRQASTAASPYYFLGAPLEVDGAHSCNEDFPREVESTTPDVCEDARTTPRGGFIQVRAKRAGTCELTVRLTGTSISASQRFAVTLGAADIDGGAPPDASSDAGVTDAGADGS